MINLRNALLAAGILVAGGLTAFSCSDNSGNGPGNPGTGGSTGSAGTTGTAGTTGGGGTGGGNPNFMAVAPCNTESGYMAGTTITFPAGTADFSYSPKCLKVSAGATVTFSGDFSSHPLEPSTTRGTLTGNPITATESLPDGGTMKSFTFPTPGFYAYYCMFHDPSDTGNFMSGVIWVE